MTTGNHFKRFLRKNGLTVNELSEKTNIPAQYFNEVINNQIYLKKKVARKVMTNFTLFKTLKEKSLVPKEKITSNKWIYGGVLEEYYNTPLVVMIKNNINDRISFECMQKDQYGYFSIRGINKLKYYYDENSKNYTIVAYRLNK